jgi:DNA sulfur modification protein DndE
MHFNKINLSADATSRLRSLRQRAQLTPNLLTRVALMLSLEEGSVAGVAVPDEDGMEMNRYTLTGDYDALFVALLRAVEEGAREGGALRDDELLMRLRTHLHRGVGTLAVRVKGPLDIARLARVG